MNFSDDDLKRLKLRLKESFDDQCSPIDILHLELEALLARMEAETNAADLLQLHYESGVFDDLDEGDVALIVQALEARRKSAGRP